jgi:hypothetical protein
LKDSDKSKDSGKFFFLIFSECCMLTEWSDD